MKDAEVALAVQIELVGERLGADQAGEADYPGPGFPNAGRHRQPAHVAEEILWDRRRGTLVVVQGVLGDPA